MTLKTDTIAHLTTKSNVRPASTSRLWEIDAARGVAIVMMVIYHLMYDLYYFGVNDAIFTDPFWFYFQRVTASTFIVLVGVSLALRVQQIEAKGESVTFRPFLRRGLVILGWGLVITLVTRIALGAEMAIRFGILHFIGVSVILAYPFLRLRWFNLGLGLALFVAGKIVQQITVPGSWFIWLGLEPAGYVYVDYFPLLPWFGVVLIGVWLGNSAYHHATRRFYLPDWQMPALTVPLQWMGRHSLTIYLIHQPLLFVLLIPLLSLTGMG